MSRYCSLAVQQYILLYAFLRFFAEILQQINSIIIDDHGIIISCREKLKQQ